MPNTVFPFDNSYARDLPGFYEHCRPATVPQPLLLFFNRGLAEELRLGLAGHDDAALAEMLR
jgi:serine/tyrosine/threonine adenylyltransferase